MIALLASRLRLRVAVTVALLAPWLAMPVTADERDEFRAAIAQASAQYRAAMTTLETRGREETAAAVQRFRASWQHVIDRFSADRLAAAADDEEYPAMFTVVDARIVGALIVIDIGSREAARDALAPIADTLAQLSARTAPPR